MAALTAIRRSVRRGERQRTARRRFHIRRSNERFGAPREWHVTWAIMRRLLAGGIGGALLMGCGSDSTGPTPSSSPDALWSAPLNWHTVNLALQSPYDTAQLTAVPQTATGTPLTIAGGVTYSSADSTVTVSTTGLVTAHYRTSNTLVIARATVGNVTVADTAVIQVVDSAPVSPVATLSIQPRADGLMVAHTTVTDFSDTTVVRVYATLANGDSVCTGDVAGCPALLVSLSSSNRTVALIGTDGFGIVDPRQVGRTTFNASTLAYGVALRDSLPFSIGYPSGVGVNVFVHGTGAQTIPYLYGDDYNHPSTMSVGGNITFYNTTGQQLETSAPYQTETIVNVVDDDPHKLIDTLVDENDFGRLRFDSAGTYTVHVRLLGTGQTLSKTVIVKPYP